MLDEATIKVRVWGSNSNTWCILLAQCNSCSMVGPLCKMPFFTCCHIIELFTHFVDWPLHLFIVAVYQKALLARWSSFYQRDAPIMHSEWLCLGRIPWYSAQGMVTLSTGTFQIWRAPHQFSPFNKLRIVLDYIHFKGLHFKGKCNNDANKYLLMSLKPTIAWCICW